MDMDRTMNNERENGNVTGNETRLEQALCASELSYRRLFEAAQDGILILDVDTGRITDVNPFLFKLLGFPRSGMVGKTVGELSPFKDIWSNKVMLERLQEDGYVRYHDLPLETRDGRKIAVEFVSNVYQAGDKKVIQCNIRDITAHKKVENAAIRLAAIIESSDDAIIGKDLDGTIQSWNTGAEKLFGYSAGEMIGTSMIRLIPADRQDEENQILEKIRHGESMRNVETVWQARDGRWIDVSVTVSPIKDSTGKIVGASKVARDITERKRAEAALRQSEEQFRLITENLADLVAVLDLDGRRLYNSPSYREILGDPDKLRGSSSFDQVHPEDRARVQQAFQEMVRTGVGQRLEYRLVSQDGHARYIESQGNVIRDAQGRVSQVVVVSRDVTERREAEESLRWSETQLKVVLESTADGILAVDNKGKVIKANRRFAELWRIPKSLMDGEDDRALLDFVREQLSDPDAFFKKVQSLYTSEAVDMDTLGFKDGRIFERYSSPILTNGVITGRVWSFRDITERRKLQAQFIEAQKMEAVGQLAAGVAHDFNNILAIIMGYNNLIEAELEPHSPLRKYAEEIQHSADRATGLTRQLLIFSRKETVQPVVLDLNDAVKNLDKMLRRSFVETFFRAGASVEG
jgi:PAS domain S-box-containing protein